MHFIKLYKFFKTLDAIEIQIQELLKSQKHGKFIQLSQPIYG